MVDQRRSRYVGGAEGAPPLPPPGGYQRPGRASAGLDAAAGLPPASADLVYTAPAAPKRTSALGIAAVATAALFAITLLVLLMTGGTDAIYGISLLVVQLLVIGVIVAALLTRRGRMLGAIALVAALVFNVATVGAMSALRSAATQAYDGTKSEQQRHEEAYPGVRDHSNYDALNGPSLEQVQRQGDELMAAVRERLTERLGYTWVQAGAVDVSPERNGYGGESMLKRYVSPTWTTAEPVHDNQRKREIMIIIDQVLMEHDMWGLYPLNVPASGLSDDMVAKLYGSADVERQHTWEYYADTYPDPLRFYVTTYDLSKDATGEFRTQREAIAQQTGEPVEGVQLMIIARNLLSEQDRAEFEERLREYPDF
ncbi:hypothetical protein [Microbacterium esteraromaticum]|uniref:hypothetical protein n=1 Tax=Microbacterium esteraromaticum TaxID=57043 RepID=UPI001C9829B3|nr:hypothetical protein [Microbacterium esteraromaticum]MBY6061895.1 hypothetical protein [Microbacterium esteraromaticum]